MKIWWKNQSPISHLASNSNGVLEDFSMGSWGFDLKNELNLRFNTYKKTLIDPKMTLINCLNYFLYSRWNSQKALGLAETVAENLHISIDWPMHECRPIDEPCWQSVVWVKHSQNAVLIYHTNYGSTTPSMRCRLDHIPLFASLVGDCFSSLHLQFGSLWRTLWIVLGESCLDVPNLNTLV